MHKPFYEKYTGIFRAWVNSVYRLSSGGGGGGGGGEGPGDEVIIVYTATSRAINEAIKQKIREINIRLHNTT